MTAPKQPNSPSPAEQIMQMGMSHTASRVLAAGVRLRVFSHLAAGQHTIREIAQTAGASERGMRMLLDALTALELLTKKEGHYRLTPASERYLVREAPEYLGALFEDDSLWETWSKLPEAVQTGKPVRRLESQQGAEAFFPILVRSLHVINREPAQRTAQALGVGSSRHGLRVLDVACGSGVWGIAMAEADATARVTMQDFSGVLSHTRKYVEHHRLADRCDYLPGDLKTVDYGVGRYDLALLGNIVHSEGERSSRDLFARLYRALAPQGRIVVIDMVPNNERSGPPYAVLFALTMLLNTEAGDIYTLDEYTRWLTAAGFDRVETAEIGMHSPLVIGVKK